MIQRTFVPTFSLLFTLAAVWVFGPLTGSARATTFVPVPFPKRVGDAELIVRAVAAKSSADWVTSADGSRRIFTFTEMRAVEVIKEPESNPLRAKDFKVRELGGTKDGLGMQVAGTAEFAPGEEVVLMLGPVQEDGSYPVRGMMMGKYRLERDAQGREVLQGAGVDDEAPWTLEHLKKVVAEQGHSGGQGSSPSPSVAPGRVDGQAPGLQPEARESAQVGAPDSSGGAETASSGQRLLGLALVAGLFALAVWLGLKKRR